jgi:large conductance mechanosensitive channel
MHYISIKKMVKKLLLEFKEFLKEYKVAGLAIAFIIGVAAGALIKSLVNDIIMPLITPFIPGGAWQSATLTLGPIVLRLGSFGGELLNFIVIAFAVFLIAKMLLREEKVSKK